VGHLAGVLFLAKFKKKYIKGGGEKKLPYTLRKAALEFGSICVIGCQTWDKLYIDIIRSSSCVDRLCLLAELIPTTQKIHFYEIYGLVSGNFLARVFKEMSFVISQDAKM
jgi:hypothetical protein